MDHELLRRIVRIEACFDSGETKVGTGFRVGPGQVLTAQHVVEHGHLEQAIERAEKIHVLVDEGGRAEKVLRAPATVAWAGEDELKLADPEALDAVLLADELPHEDLKPFRDWVSVPLGDSGCWETDGFAAAGQEAGRMGTEYLWGTCHPARELATYIKLTVDRDAPLPGKDGEPGTWAGVSGGPVLVKDGRYRGYLYGIVRASPRRFGDSLYAVGTPALLHDAELCNLLGIKGPAPPHASLVERLRDLIAQDGDLAEKLASLDPVWKSRWDDEDADGLVDELCTRGSLKEALERLRGLCQRLESTTRVVEDLAVTLVSILASRDLPGGRDLTADSVRRIQLGTASPNFAEALLAAAYGAPCRYEKVDGPKPDLPRAYLRVPAPTLEGGLLPDSQTEEQLKEILWKFLKNDLASSKWVLDGEKAIFDHLPPGRQKKMLEQLVEQKLGRMKENHGRPAYLVVVGKMQESAGIGPFLDQLKEVLPSLDLVVLESDFERVSDALRQEDELWPLWEILNLVPEEFRP